MQKSLALSITLCLGLAGCQVFEKSETWETVMRVRPGDSIREPDPSSSYAEKLHRVLLDQGVEHVVVTYQYHYYTNHYDEALGTRTAVVYRDNATPAYPWWLKDDRLATPFWLPNGDLDKQLSFYARRNVEVLEKKVYPAHGGSGKTAVTLFRLPQAHLRATALEKTRPVTRVAQVKTTQAPPAKPLFAARPATERPLATAPAVRPAPVTRIQQPSTVPVPKPKPFEILPTVAAAPLTNPFWSPPTALNPAEQPAEAAPREEHLGRLFRLRNGTSYDRNSSVDRRKMEQLKQASLGREAPGEGGFRRTPGGPSTAAQF